MWCPAGGAELCIAHAFACPPTLSVKIRRTFWRRRLLKKTGDPCVDITLGGGGVITDIINARWHGRICEVDKSPCSIIPVDLVDPARTPVFEHGAAFKEFFQEDGSSRAVEPCQPRDNSSGIQGKRLGFEKDLSGLPIRLGRGTFIDPFAAALGIDRGASGKKDTPGS